MRKSKFEIDHGIQSSNLCCKLHRMLRTIKLASPDASTVIHRLAGSVDELIVNTDVTKSPAQWGVSLCGLRLLANQLKCAAIARSGHGDLIAESTRAKYLQKEFDEAVKLNHDLFRFIRSPSHSECLDDSEKLRNFLLAVPLPAHYWTAPRQNDCHQDEPSHQLSSFRKAPLIRIIAFLDSLPIATPQLLRSDLLYSVSFRIKGLQWPDEAERFHLQLLSTCPPTEYAVSKFLSSKPDSMNAGEFELEMQGNIKFNTGQSTLLDDIIFDAQSAFELPSGEMLEAVVIGHNQLRVRVTDDSRQPLLTGNRTLDRHISELATKLVQQCPSAKYELRDLMPMLEALTRLLATYAQEAIYKGETSVKEADFQKQVLRDLRNMLGQDVQEHVGQAGGLTDIRFRSVIVELKVETTNASRDYLAAKYTPQSSQYSGVEARQAGIVLVLDLTEKEKPPGDIRNDIRLFDVATHGDDGGNKYPSKAFLFVVNGNMRSPSSYSK